MGSSRASTRRDGAATLAGGRVRLKAAAVGAEEVGSGEAAAKDSPLVTQDIAEAQGQGSSGRRRAARPSSASPAKRSRALNVVAGRGRGAGLLAAGHQLFRSPSPVAVEG